MSFVINMMIIMAIAGAGYVLAKTLAAAEITIVGVNRRRRMVVVAGTKVRVAHEPSRIASHNQRHLGVRLETDQSIDNVSSCFLQTISQRNIRCLVEPRHELNNDGNFFS